MAEWSKAHDWKSCVRLKRTEGSNPSLSAIYIKTLPRGGFLFFGLYNNLNLCRSIMFGTVKK